MHRVMQHALFGVLGFGDVGQGADHSRDLAVGADHGPRFQRKPHEMTVGRAQAETCCITGSPSSITISTRPPSSAGPTMSLVTEPATVMPAAITQTTSKNQVGINSTARSKPWVER